MDKNFKKGLYTTFAVILMGSFLGMCINASIGGQENLKKKMMSNFETRSFYSKDEILIIDNISSGPKYVVYTNLPTTKKDYYSPESGEWYSINPKSGKIDGTTIMSNSIFPLDFYLTDAEREKETFTLEELEAIKERIEEKDSTLTRTQN